MEIPWHIKAKRRVLELGLSYPEIGEVLGLTASGVGHYLNGRRHPKPGMLRNLAKVLDMSLSELIEDDPNFARDKDESEAMSLIRKIPKDQREYALRMLRGMASDSDIDAPAKSE